MRCATQFVAVLLFAAASGVCDQKGGAKAPPPPRPNPGRAAGAPRGGGNPKPGPRLTNPRNPIARLYTMAPDQRERVLEKLPPAAQERARKNLEWFDALPKDQQQIVLQRAERLAALPPDRQHAFQQSFRAFQQLPQDRRQALGGALRRLQMMNDAQRTIVLNSDQFRTGFSPEEQKIILDLSEVIVPQ
jgi:Protein of unknown function (DUF3106)